MSTGKKRLLVYTVMILCLIASVKLIKDIIKIKSADNRLLEVEQEREAARKEQDDLKLKLAETGGDRWFEKQVRDVLKMARPEEVVVMIPEEIGKQSKELFPYAKAAGDENSSNFQMWWQLLFK